MNLDELGAILERERALVRRAVQTFIDEYEGTSDKDLEDMKKLYQLLTENDFNLNLLRK